MTIRVLGRKLFTRIAFVANFVLSYLTVSFALTQLRNADSSYTGNTLGIEVLGLWAMFEVLAVLFLVYLKYGREGK